MTRTRPTRALRLTATVPAVLLALSLAACGGDGGGGDGGDGGDGSPSEPTSETTSAAGDTGAASEPAEAEQGGSDGASAGGAPSKEEFVEQANAICAEGNAALAEASQNVDPEDTAAVAVFATTVLAPNILGQLQDMQALGFPEGDEQVLAGIFADATTAVQQVATDPSSLVASPGPFDAVNEQLVDYGLTECGS